MVYGFVREVTCAGVPFLRVDIPAADHPEHRPSPDGPFRFSSFYRPDVLYGFHPIAADLCVRMAKHRNTPPVERWELPDEPTVVMALPPARKDDDIPFDVAVDRSRWLDDGGTPDPDDD